jgi:hypothetical protein
MNENGEEHATVIFLKTRTFPTYQSLLVLILQQNSEWFEFNENASDLGNRLARTSRRLHITSPAHPMQTAKRRLFTQSTLRPIFMCTKVEE